LTTEQLVIDLQKIGVSGKHLLALISDILDLSKIEAGKMDLNLQCFDLRTLVDGVINNIHPLVEEHANRLELGYTDDLGTMCADLTKVRQVLLNLLSNAAKFTERGTISLLAEREATVRGDWVIFRIKDTGIGMSMDEQRQLFKEFTQVDASSTRKYGGTGLGLALSRRLCQLMGGNITVVSALGQGSTFTVRIPADVANPGNKTIGTPPATPPRSIRSAAPVDGVRE
jgi:signal transduction histidine kinase